MCDCGAMCGVGRLAKFSHVNYVALAVKNPLVQANTSIVVTCLASRSDVLVNMCKPIHACVMIVYMHACCRAHVLYHSCEHFVLYAHGDACMHHDVHMHYTSTYAYT